MTSVTPLGTDHALCTVTVVDHLNRLVTHRGHN
jgi:hypothetical protein